MVYPSLKSSQKRSNILSAALTQQARHLNRSLIFRTIAIDHDGFIQSEFLYPRLTSTALGVGPIFTLIKWMLAVTLPLVGIAGFVARAL